MLLQQCRCDVPNGTNLFAKVAYLGIRKKLVRTSRKLYNALCCLFLQSAPAVGIDQRVVLQCADMVDPEAQLLNATFSTSTHTSTGTAVSTQTLYMHCASPTSMLSVRTLWAPFSDVSHCKLQMISSLSWWQGTSRRSCLPVFRNGGCNRKTSTGLCRSTFTQLQSSLDNTSHLLKAGSSSKLPLRPFLLSPKPTSQGKHMLLHTPATLNLPFAAMHVDVL